MELKQKLTKDEVEKVTILKLARFLAKHVADRGGNIDHLNDVSKARDGKGHGRDERDRPSIPSRIRFVRSSRPC